MAVVGFDFGTTNTLISSIQGGKPIFFLDDRGMPIPSVVCYEGSKTIVGHEAKERLSEVGLGVQGNVVRSPKMLIGREHVFVGGVERSPTDIVRDVVAHVRQQALASKAVKGLSINKAIVTIPVNMEGYKRAALRDAFRAAGIAIVQFIHEPLAALYAFFRSSVDFEALVRRYDRQLMLVLDWGGGTLDLTLCRLTDGMLVQVQNDGTEEVGGDVFDDRLKNEIERRVRAKRQLGEEVLVQVDAMTRLLHRCERAKIDLSTRARASVFVSNFYRGVADPDLEYALSREEMEQMVEQLLDEGLSRVQRLLSQAGYAPASIALCLATGGMANMPIVRSRLHEIFGPQRVHISEQSAMLIAEGAAWVAHDDAKLRLAKNVELLLARNSRLSLVKAGTEMPREGEVQKQDFSLYCVDPRDGFAKFQIQAPVRPGPMVLPNEARIPLENLVVPVDAKARPFFERLEMEVQINENLILQANARSLVKLGFAETQVHNLEFALSLPLGDVDEHEDDESDREDEEEQDQGEEGVLTIRSNLSDVPQNRFVPGELLYTYNPEYFDVRMDPPRIQDEERLYYTPCSICRRASNDPLCRCASELKTTARGLPANPA